MSHTYAGRSTAIVSSTNATPIVVTSTAHGRANGEVINIANHFINYAANGEWVVASATANTFELTGSVGNGVGGASGTVTGYPATVTLPDDITDQRSAASVNVPFQGLADRLKMLKEDYEQRLQGIFPLTSGPATRVVRQPPQAVDTDWVLVAGSFHWTSLLASTQLIAQVALPQRSTWQAFSVTLNGNAAPGTPILLKAYRQNIATGAVTAAAGFAASTNDVPTGSIHQTTVTGGTVVIDNVAYLYFISITSEAAGSASHYYGATASYLVNAGDVYGGA